MVSSVGDPQPLYNSSTESGFIASRFFVLGTPIHTNLLYLVCNYTRTITSRPPRPLRRLYHPDSSRTSRGGRGARAPVTQTLRSPPLAAESRLCFALPVTIDALDYKFKLTAGPQPSRKRSTTRKQQSTPYYTPTPARTRRSPSPAFTRQNHTKLVNNRKQRHHYLPQGDCGTTPPPSSPP